MSLATTRPKRLVLIDDDETYNAIMLRAAAQAHVQLDAFTSLMDLGSVAFLGRYDAAIVDYQLAQMTGVEVAAYLSALFRNVPMILVSQSPEAPPGAQSWPGCIAAFIPKSAGYAHVLGQATRLAGKSV